MSKKVSRISGNVHWGGITSIHDILTSITSRYPNQEAYKHLCTEKELRQSFAILEFESLREIYLSLVGDISEYQSITTCVIAENLVPLPYSDMSLAEIEYLTATLKIETDFFLRKSKLYIDDINTTPEFIRNKENFLCHFEELKALLQERESKREDFMMRNGISEEDIGEITISCAEMVRLTKK